VNFLDEFGLSASDNKAFTNRPVTTGAVSSPYGPRTDVDTGTVGSFHTGIDYSVVNGTPVISPGKGTVRETGNSPFYGNYVIVDHTNGLTTVPMHLSTISVQAGNQVLGGDVLGTSGNTGTAAAGAYHLHESVFKTDNFTVVDNKTWTPTSLTSENGRIVPKQTLDPSLYFPK